MVWKYSVGKSFNDFPQELDVTCDNVAGGTDCWITLFHASASCFTCQSDKDNKKSENVLISIE